MPVLGTASGSGSVLPGWVNIKDYGAKVDGVMVTDAAITSGQNTLACTTSTPFTSTAVDGGKTVHIRGAGAAGADLITTISTVTDSGHAVLAANAGTTVSGALATFGSDDTTAVRTALTAVVTAGGGTLYHPGGICILAGAPQTGTVSGYGYSGVLTIPARTRNAGPAMIRLLGPTPPAQFFYGSYNSQVIAPQGGAAVFHVPATSGNALDCIPNASGDSLGLVYTSWSVSSENLIWRLPNNPQAGGLKLAACSDASIVRTSITVHTEAAALANPTGSAVALYLPPMFNNGLTEARNVDIYGFAKGLIHAEHTILDNVYIVGCGVGLIPAAATSSHLSYWQSIYIGECGIAVQPTSTSYVTGHLSLESKSQINGPTYKIDIDDLSDYLVGDVKYVRFDSSASAPQPAFVNRARNLDVKRLDKPARKSSQQATSVSTSFLGLAANAYGVPQMDSGQTWMHAIGSAWQVDGNGAFCSNSGYQNAQMLPINTATPTVTMVVRTGSNVSNLAVGVSLLGSGAASLVEAILSPTQYQILKDNGTLLASAAFTPATNTTYTLVVDYGITTAHTVTMKVNGSTAVSYLLSAGEQTTYEANAGWIGMVSVLGDSFTRVQSFSAV